MSNVFSVAYYRYSKMIEDKFDAGAYSPEKADRLHGKLDEWTKVADERGI